MNKISEKRLSNSKKRSVILKRYSKLPTFNDIPRTHIKGSVADDIDNDDNEVMLLEVKALKAGESFGEVALLQNKPRQATIVCREETELAVLDKEYYDKILSNSYELIQIKDIINVHIEDFEDRKLEEHIKFFGEMKMFSTWSYNKLQNVYLHTIPKEYKRNQYVFQKGEIPNEVYFIKSGEFKIISEYDLPNQFSEVDFEDNNPIMIIDSNKKNLKRNFDICLLSTKEFFGEEEVIENCPRKYNVICCSTLGEIYALKAKDFIHKIYGEYNAREFISKQMKHRLKIHDNRIKITKQMMQSNRSFASIPRRIIANSNKNTLSPEKQEVHKENSALNFLGPLQHSSTSPNLSHYNNIDATEIMNSAKKFTSPVSKNTSELLSTIASTKPNSKLKLTNKLRETEGNNKFYWSNQIRNMHENFKKLNSQNIFESPIRLKRINGLSWVSNTQMDISKSFRQGSSKIFHEETRDETLGKDQEIEGFRLNLLPIDKSPEENPKPNYKMPIMSKSLSVPPNKKQKNILTDTNIYEENIYNNEGGYKLFEKYHDQKVEMTQSYIKKELLNKLKLENNEKLIPKLSRISIVSKSRPKTINERIRGKLVNKILPIGIVETTNTNADEEEYEKLKLEIEPEINKRVEKALCLVQYFYIKKAQEKGEDINSEEFQKKIHSVPKMTQKEISDVLEIKKSRGGWNYELDIQKLGSKPQKLNLSLDKACIKLFYKTLAENNENEHLNISEIMQNLSKHRFHGRQNLRNYSKKEENTDSMISTTMNNVEIKSRSIDIIRKRNYLKEIEQIKSTMILKREGKNRFKSDTKNFTVLKTNYD